MTNHHKILWLWANGRAALCRLRRHTVRNHTSWNELYYKELWYKGILSECEWWDQWLSTDDGSKWKLDSQNPQRLLQDHVITNCLSHIGYDSISILDVGAGPVTSLGYTYPGKQIKITAVDPLAKEYEKILKKAGVFPPVPTLTGYGERLLDRFDPASFDFVYASNSLDHSFNPLLIIQNMVAVVKRNGFVILRHYANEGKTGNYLGLHQWNFDTNGNDLILWNKAGERNVTHLLHGTAQVECYRESSLSHGYFDHSDWVVAVIKKLGDR